MKAAGKNVAVDGVSVTDDVTRCCFPPKGLRELTSDPFSRWVPTIGFDLLYALIIVRLNRRELVWVNVTAHPTAEWIAAGVYRGLPLE